MKKLTCIFCFVLLLTGCYQKNLPKKDNVKVVEKEMVAINEDEPMTQEEELKLLTMKTLEAELTDYEEDYIEFFYIGKSNGVAVLNLEGIGMHQMTGKIYTTTNCGKKWHFLKEIILTSGTAKYYVAEEGLTIDVCSNVTNESVKTLLNKKELWGE